MSLRLAFHDSEIRDVSVVDGDTLRVRFSAAAVRRDGRDAGWMGDVVLTLSRAAVTGELGQALGKVVEGGVRHDGRSLATVPLPEALSGALELLLRFANGSQVAARGRALAVSAGPGAVYTEDLSC